MSSLHGNMFTFEELTYEPLPPTISSIYLWDACRAGKLFFPEVYDLSSVKRWIEDFLSNIVSSVEFPKYFNRQKIIKIFIERAIDSFNNSEFKKIYDSADAKDLNYIRDLIRKSEEKTTIGFKKIVNFLKENNDFPTILWIEFKRFSDIYVDVMQLMFKSMDKWYRLFPRKKSQIASKSKLAKVLAEPYNEIASNFVNAFMNFFKVLLFLEIWSRETEDDLFTDKPWSFKKVNFEAFEKVIFDFHDSLNNLSMSLLKFKPEEKLYDFSDPVGWALKRLMLLPGA